MKLKITILSLLMLSLLSSSYATKWRVNNNNGADADFTTFEEAVDGAKAMDTLYFEGSTTCYGEDVTLNKPLVIIGPGYFLTDNKKTQANQLTAYIGGLLISPAAKGTILTGITIGTNSDNKDLTLNADNIFVYRCRITDDINLAKSQNVKNIAISCCFIGSYIQYFSNSFTSTSIVIKNNIIHNSIYFKKGSTLLIDGNTISNSINVEDSEIINNIQYHAASNEGICNNGNIVKNNIIVGSKCPNDAGVSNNKTGVDPSTLFIDYPDPSDGSSRDGRYRLAEGSPAKAAGIEGIDCGAFGGNDPYVLSGLPPAPHIYDAIIPASGDDVNGLPVTVKIELQQ